MNKKELFKIGFLVQLCDLGISPNEFTNALSKQASLGFGKRAGSSSFFGGITDLLKGTAGLLFLVPPALSALLGSQLGSYWAKHTTADMPKIKELQKQELAGMYRRAALKLLAERGKRKRKDVPQFTARPG